MPRSAQRRARCRGRSRRRSRRRAPGRRGRRPPAPRTAAARRSGWSGRPARTSPIARGRGAPRRVDPRLDPDRRQLDHLGAERRAGVAARPLAWARARVTTTRAAVQRPALEPGERLAARDDRRRRRSSPGRRSPSRSTALGDRRPASRRRCAGRASCRARPPRPARRRSRPGRDQRRGDLAEALDAHVEDEGAGEARRAPPSRAPSPASRGPRGR